MNIQLFASSSFTLYSNDGNDILFASNVTDPVEVTATGIVDDNGVVCTYTGHRKFAGVSASANATTATYKSGDTLVANSGSNYVYYLVEEDYKYVGMSAVTEVVKKTGEYVTSVVSGKQDTLVSGTNIKTINNTSILGSGNITVSGSSTDVQVNGTSITSNDVANLITNTAYNASTNKIATMSDLPATITITTTSGSQSVSDGTNTLSFGSNAFNSTSIPSTYIKSASVSGSTLTLTKQDNTTVTFTDTGEANVQSDWSVTDSTSDAYIKNKPTIPSAVTSINGLSGGSLTSPLVIWGGDAVGQPKLVLDNTRAGQVTDSNTSTLFGFLSNNATTFTVGGSGYALNLRGSGTRPQYKGNDMALLSDVSTTAQSISYTTTAPSSANTNGLKICVLSSEPSTKYSGWLYLIEES